MHDHLRQLLAGCTFNVANDPDFPGFLSVYADRDGTGAELAGKIGEPAVARAIAQSLAEIRAARSPHGWDYV